MRKVLLAARQPFPCVDFRVFDKGKSFALRRQALIALKNLPGEKRNDLRLRSERRCVVSDIVGSKGISVLKFKMKRTDMSCRAAGAIVTDVEANHVFGMNKAFLAHRRKDEINRGVVVKAYPQRFFTHPDKLRTEPARLFPNIQDGKKSIGFAHTGGIARDLPDIKLIRRAIDAL